MITLITGVPGSGKTLYAVWKLLRHLVGTSVEHTDDDGKVTQIPRRIFSNINGLLIDHTMMTNDQIATWQDWAKAGDIIVADEVQKVPQWKKAPPGSKVPPCIEALETHRHMGVDFVVLTQGPMLIHDNVTRLVGRHLHIRRLGNMPFATVYEWDGCSRALLFKNTMAKAAFWFPKAAYKLYKSAEVHTKQKRSAPALLWVVGGALLIFTTQAPGFYNRLMDRFNPPAKVVSAATPKVDTAPPVPIQPAPSLHSAPTAPAGTYPSQQQAQPRPGVLAGCIRRADRCDCFDTTGAPLEPDVQLCLTHSGANRGPAIDIGPDTPNRLAQAHTNAGDIDALTFMRTQRMKAGDRQ